MAGPARIERIGQVAQLVERGPEKAGVGGSIPSLATMFSSTYESLFSGFVPFCSKIQIRLAGFSSSAVGRIGESRLLFSRSTVDRSSPVTNTRGLPVALQTIPRSTPRENDSGRTTMLGTDNDTQVLWLQPPTRIVNTDELALRLSRSRRTIERLVRRSDGFHGGVRSRHSR
jgi:hypothetical protein